MIPRKVHLTWIDKNVFDNPSPLIQQGIVKMRDLNPDWEFTIYTDNEVEDYLKTKLPPEVYTAIQPKHVVQKSDLWRLIKLYEEGGVYTDIDRFCDQPFPSEPEIRWYLPTCREYDFSHDFMMTAPGNPVFDIAIKLYMMRLMEGHQSVYFLGPQTYMHAVTLGVTGEMINTNPEPGTFDQIEARANQIGGIRIIREDPPYKTIIFTGDNGLDWEQEKRALYKSCGMKHWTGDW